MAVRGYIGIDFGTSNSYFSYANLESRTHVEPIPLRGRDSVTSCLLWRPPERDDADILAFGESAIQEWAESVAEGATEDRRFAAGFKPDIRTSEQARHDAWGFLRACYLTLVEQRTPQRIGAAAGMPVVIGVPAEIPDDQVAATRTIAERAGFGTVQAVAEPIGALTYHLAHADITAEEARQGVVIVDFGGGTLDVAVVDRQGVRAPWGCPILGGRLFDDLFFTWLLDQDPKLAEDVARGRIAAPDLAFGWLVGCRDLKEQFSRHWAHRAASGQAGFADFRGSAALLPGRVLGRLRDRSLDEFLDRARHYRPSALARRHFAALGGALGRLGEDGPVDLLAWVRSELAGAPAGALPRDPAKVVLTGGSGGWPFMRAMVAEVFGIPDDRIIRSARPEATISEGLSLYHVLRHHNERIKAALRAEQPARQEQLAAIVGERFKVFARAIAERVAAAAVGVVEPRFVTWYRQGGRLTEVEAAIEADLNGPAFRAAVEQVMIAEKDHLTAGVAAAMGQNLAAWLGQHGVRLDRGSFRADIGLGPAVDSRAFGGLFDDIGNDINAVVQMTLLTTVATIAAKISGGAGLALIAGGPLGLIIGALIGIAVFLGFRGWVEAGVRDFIKGYAFGSVSLALVHLRLSEDDVRQRLREGADKLTPMLAEEIERQLGACRQQIIAHVDDTVRQVVEDLSLLDRLG